MAVIMNVLLAVLATTVFNPADNTCLAVCAGGTGTNSARVCGETASNDTCANATTRYDVGDDMCRANNNCGGGEFRGGGSFGTNSCYTLAEVCRCPQWWSFSRGRWQLCHGDGADVL